MRCKGTRKSKRQKCSLKYNVQKRVREHKRRVRKEAKKLGVKKKTRKDPGIPNNWPYKKEMLQDLERRQEQRELDLAARREEAKQKNRDIQEEQEEEARQSARAAEAARRARRDAEVEKTQKDALRRALTTADVLVEVLDARDPMGCRCTALEEWAVQAGKRIVFVLTKADTIGPKVAARWLQFLGQVGPAIAVQAEAGREGIPELLTLLRHPPPGAATQPAAAIVGYPRTGKKTLSRALRREAKVPVRWLLDAVGQLRPTKAASSGVELLQLAMRSALPHSVTSGVDHLDTVRSLLDRADITSVMRRFRIPAFEGWEGFLQAFAAVRRLKTKSGQEPGLAFIAKQVVPLIPAMPGCACAAPSDPPGEGAVTMLWTAHGASRAQLEAMMQAQIAVLSDRAPGNTVGGIVLRSGGFGPAVDLKSILEEDEPDPAFMELLDGDQADESEGEEEGAEDGEEEMMEGEEEEEEDDDDAEGMES
mmetsp:Transcript_79438/g.184328  ORF Transcript_79438/g.184328 Transcript_79438/m.184328 type:complete len:479 (+) Transcript_79438:59-1495(+)|eukprot:CAMPEP_0171058800 /NCGR_PEP_ID=MMETSP0766_2-20121228/2746_1 /TAXON_ID=439317 /ORGANISM="Gambierdiscus australes, Strain CAWD 149" /LENGTH=478 /DNA_ID=CAMNT_0011514133 /DNA_START=59 /DNA_END=1495 /DNA_ORIENTATION=+